MKKLAENRLFWPIVAGTFIIGVFILLSVYVGTLNLRESGERKPSQEGTPSGQTSGITQSMVGEKLVTKVIDGDTVIVEGGYSIRLLGMDADERGYPCYEAAKKRLEELVLNKQVYLEADKEDQDQYKRYLRYLILVGENIDLKLVEEGLAIARSSPENVKYSKEIAEAEKKARENKIGCKWSGEKTETATPTVGGGVTEITEAGITSACDAGNYIGEERIVEGTVANGYRSGTNTIFLNFEYSYPNQCFTAVIFSSALNKFPSNPETYYEGKRVRVSGTIKEYNGKPEIILEDESQIEIVS